MEPALPTNPDFPYPRRYNSLRLLGFDYASTSSLFFLTIDTDSSRPLFGDIQLAKAILAALLHPTTQERIRLEAYTLLPDHFHLLAGVKTLAKNLSQALGAYKSYTTQLYWKRCREIVDSRRVDLPGGFASKSQSDEKTKALLTALIEWRAALRPETVELKNWPKVHPDQFLGKNLWHTNFNDHVIRNDADLRETIEYIVMNPVKRGYVSRPEFYPFTGFGHHV
jgi:REP element-mobilizing transposase RayT